jgi:hypothetical protein
VHRENHRTAVPARLNLADVVHLVDDGGAALEKYPPILLEHAKAGTPVGFQLGKHEQPVIGQALLEQGLFEINENRSRPRNPVQHVIPRA